MNRRRQTRAATISTEIIPPERLRHGPIELAPSVIADEAGRPSRPYRALDTLAIMERRGSITSGMRQAGEDFRHRFAVAQLDPLRALDLSRLSLGDKPTRRGDHAPGLRAEAARNAVWRAIRAVGGIASPAGSCLWACRRLGALAKGMGARAGLGRTARQPGSRIRILIAALGALETHLR
jgi:hypothetical protein